MCHVYPIVSYIVDFKVKFNLEKKTFGSIISTLAQRNAAEQFIKPNSIQKHFTIIMTIRNKK